MKCETIKKLHTTNNNKNMENLYLLQLTLYYAFVIWFRKMFSLSEFLICIFYQIEIYFIDTKQTNAVL